MKKLIEYLATVPHGKISTTSELESLLFNHWEEFKGSDFESTESYKLVGRMEDVYWDPPLLIFKIERHGATVMGSSRAALHKWTLNLEEKTAECKTGGYRQLFKRQPNLNVKKIAEEIIPIILNEKQDERLRWYKDGTVRILIGQIIPTDSASKETVVNRRKRFRKAMDELMDKSGWDNVKLNLYSPPKDD